MYLYYWCCNYIDLVNKPWVPSNSVPFEDIFMHCLWTIWCLWDRNYSIYTFLASSVTSLNQSIDRFFFFNSFAKKRSFFATCYFFLQLTSSCQLLFPQRLTEKRTKSFCKYSSPLQRRIWFKIWVIFLTVTKRKISWLSGPHDKYVSTSEISVNWYFRGGNWFKKIKALLTGSRR